MKKDTETDVLVVEHAYLHQAVSIVGTKLGSERTLSPSKTAGIKMGWSCRMQGLIVRLQGKTAFIPAPNVASCLLATPDEE